MKHILLILIVLSISLNLFSQRGNENSAISIKQNLQERDLSDNIVTLYPVPLKDNSFTIKSNKEISLVKVTNIIGQDIFRIKFTSPLFLVKIILDNPGRGMYLVVILFSDNTRIVKKIMIEGTD